MNTLISIFHRPTPQEQVRKWTSQLRSESRALDRQLSSLTIAENKLKKTIQQLSKRNDEQNARLLAKELVRSGKQKERLWKSKAMVESIGMKLNEQYAQYKITGNLRKSTSILRNVNSAIKLPELTRTMRDLSMEFMKAGVMEEMVNDTFDIVESDDIEEDSEIDKVLDDILGGKEKVDQMPEVPSEEFQAQQPVAQQEEESDEEIDIEAMKRRLEALKG
ncbi:Vacuolar protein sorting-associated protein 24 [Neolecta irregularis DAH-3]|uniref:Vacuolar protein sorting-associated protein 24 n=1 Tax=Neolecta irregularis (strain DAH-3) TaxID=1198029 RepID=A0A1U7LW10_NEOID|nr:Vacuolar protein sorting-associated protein 24 [Neolecta irregularis DAH-3]|eukprot:OLL26865.1 Vacuolar protein sorting-associated protein 24 [Neolecta irregularis DAH-3]